MFRGESAKGGFKAAVVLGVVSVFHRKEVVVYGKGIYLTVYI
ncbi:MAG: hypothetical protein QW717_05545 [Candidatus Bathyarchaeia archaeon]